MNKAQTQFLELLRAGLWGSKRLFKLFVLFPDYSLEYLWDWFTGGVVRLEIDPYGISFPREPHVLKRRQSSFTTMCGLPDDPYMS